MADIDISMDIADVVAKSAQMLNLTNEQIAALQNYTLASVKYNDQGAKQTATVNAQFSATQKLEAVIRDTGQGFEFLSAKVVNNTKALEAQAKAAQKAAEAQAKAAQKAFEASNLSPFLDMAKRIQGTLTNLALYRGFNTITNSITESIQASRQFQKELALVQTVSQDVGVSTQTWAKGITDISNRLGLNKIDLTKGLNSVIQNQVARGPAALDVVNAGANLAKTTGSDTQASIEVVTEGMNSFGLSANRANEFAAKLWKTVDLGVVKIEQLNGTLGRVGFLARELGVSEDEVLGLLSALTRQGVKTSDAMVLISNVFTKLTKPTKEFQVLLDSLGTPTGKLLIQANGVLGAFTKIGDAVRSAKVDIAEIAPEIRSQKGFLAITQNQSQVASDIGQIKNSSGPTFEKAKEIVSETDVDKISRMAETIKNAFSTQFGDSINRAIVDIIKFAGGAQSVDEALKGADSSGKQIVKTIGALAIGIGVATIAIKGFNAASLLITRTNPLLAAGALVAGYATYRYFKPDQTAVQTANDYFAKLKDEQPTANLERQTKAVEKIKEEFKAAGQNFSKLLADAYAQTDKQLDKTNEKIKESKEPLKAAFVGIMDQAKSNLRDYERDLNRINSEIQRLNKANKQGQSGDSAYNSVMSVSSHFADAQQQPGLVLADIERVNRKQADLLKQGTPEAFQELEKLQQEKFRLLADYHSKEANYQKELFQQQLAERVAAGEHIRHGIDDVFVYDPTQHQKEANALEAQSLDFRRQELAILQKIKAEKEQQIAKEKEQLKLQETALNKFLNFSIYDTSGEIKKQYKDKFGKFDSNKAEQDYQQTTKELQNSTVPKDVREGRRAPTREELNNQIATQNLITPLLALQRQQIEQAKAKDAIVKGQRDITAATEKSNQAVKSATDGLHKYSEEAKGLLPVLAETAKMLGEASKQIPGILTEQSAKKDSFLGINLNKSWLGRQMKEGAEGLTDLNQTINPYASPVDKAFFEKKAQEAAALQERATHIKKNSIGGESVEDPAELANLKKEIVTLKTQLEDRAKNIAVQQGVKLTGSLFPEFDAGIAAIDKKITHAQSLLDESKEKLGFALQQQAQLTAEADRTTKAFDAANKSIQAMIGGIGVTAQASKEQIQGLIDTANSIGGAKPQTKFYGGPIYKAYGGPIGADNIPAWLSNNEYVVNASATRRFYSQINSMNHTARVPQYFNQGGEVTNMGGVTFNISKSDNPQATAREINRMLKRAKRQGSI